MRNKAAVLALATLFLLLPATAQDLPNLVERIDVRVIDVDVIVTDKQGRHVRGLTKDDFEIYEGHTLKPISNFFESASLATTNDVQTTPGAGNAVDDRQRRRVILFLDQKSMRPENRNLVLRHMRKFLEDSIRNQDELMIATYNQNLEIRLPFTNDLAKVNKALDQIEKEGGLGISLAHHRRDAEMAMRRAVIPRQRLLIAQSYALTVEHDLEATIEALLQLMTVVAGAEGKKILLMMGESFPMHPGREILGLIERFGEEASQSQFGLDADLSEVHALQPPGRITMQMDKLFDKREMIEDVARVANANGITLYPIHAGGIGEGTDAVAEHGANSETTGLSTEAMRNTSEAMKLVADLTGGKAVVGGQHYQLALKQIREDLESYYSIGYRAGDQLEKKGRRIRVRVKNPSYVVRARRERIDKTPTEEMSDQAVANLLDVRKPNDLGLVLTTGRPIPAGMGRYRVPVKLIIPVDALTILPQGDLRVGGFEVFAVVADGRNSFSNVVRSPHRLTLDEKRFASLQGQTYTYSLDLLVRSGHSNLSFAVVDAVSGTQGFGRMAVQAP